MTLKSWLDHIQQVHPHNIDYSLERIRIVAERLALLQPKVPVLMVTGTNGKGSTVSALEALFLIKNYRVGSFTSPYLQVFNEQIRLNKIPVSDELLINAFQTIDTTRQEISLSEFEFTTLAALFIFKNAPLDIIVLEVGLGGGADAVNIVEPILTIISSLSLDHQEYLGHSIDVIAANEAELLAPGKVGIIGMHTPPRTLIETAQQRSCQLLCFGQDFYARKTSIRTWEFKTKGFHYQNLPLPKILINNAAVALQALLVMGISFTATELEQGLNAIEISGRLQLLPSNPAILIDVAHNPESVENLALHVTALKTGYAKVIAVFSIFRDKDIHAAIRTMAPLIDAWFIAPISHPRAAAKPQLLATLLEEKVAIDNIKLNNNLEAACQQALAQANTKDLIVAFGSFFVARAALTFYDS